MSFFFTQISRYCGLLGRRSADTVMWNDDNSISNRNLHGRVQCDCATVEAFHTLSFPTTRCVAAVRICLPSLQFSRLWK